MRTTFYPKQPFRTRLTRYSECHGAKAGVQSPPSDAGSLDNPRDCRDFAALAACGAREPRMPGPAAVLLFSGTGASPGDVDAIREILAAERLPYSTADSAQLNRMSESQLRAYRLVIVPGGNFVDIGRSLTPGAVANLRAAVGNGLNYLGICAGAFFAGNSPYNGLNLTSGTRFGFYSAEARGIRKTAVAITDARGHTLDQYWEDGPQLSGWGDVVARYPTEPPP